MPIDYKEYHPKWKLISRLVRFRRANNRCEFCGIKNYSVIRRRENNRKPTVREAYAIRVLCAGGIPFVQALKWYGFTKIILTVAHLDRDKHNNHFNNLAALCQKCHLGHDMQTHIANRKYGRDHKKSNLKLEL